MSASYSIIKEHNGEIEVSRSEPGKGTSIRIWFPQKTSKESEKEKKEIPLSSIKILWVEDEKPVRNVLEKMLGVLKRNFDMVETGNRALKLLEKAKYDVLVTDLGMPEMNGWQLADTVSEKYPELLIVLVTGWDAEVTDNDLKNHNIFRVLGKPVGLTQINSLLAELKAELEKSEKN